MKRLKRIVVCVLFGAMCFSSFVDRKETQALKVSANHRYFMTSDGKPFFWLGDTGWLLFSKLDRGEAERYLEDRKQKGFNVIQVMLLHELVVVNKYGDSALTNKNVATPKTLLNKNFLYSDFKL